MGSKVIGDRIKKARDAAGLTQADLAEMVKVEPASVSRWEQGQSMPRPKRVKEIAKALNRDVDWLVGIEPRPEKKHNREELEARLKALENQLNAPTYLKAQVTKYKPSVPKEILEALANADESTVENIRLLLGLTPK
ncbi:helix-turn-helix transcriptional regulator [Bdellovibrionales bacterium]|nr:helix-turn-helix transcriptional regulator [Bdellovibrionales bacterium]